MKGPSEEERLVPFVVNQAAYYQEMPSYDIQAAQYYQQQSANLNGNNSGNYYYIGETPADSAAQSFYQVYPAAEPSPTSPDDSNPFAEYAWMADAEEFEKQVIEQMEQEEYLEACFQQMWEEEESEGGWYTPVQGSVATPVTEMPSLDRLSLGNTQPPTMLNPNAAEFVPRWAIAHHQ